MPIYEFRCTKCESVFELLTLKINEIIIPVCPKCFGVGVKLISAPSIVYSMFDERATHRLPDWKQKMAQAEVHDARVKRHLASTPLPHDRGQDIKVYDTDFGKTERNRLIEKAQLDNMP